MYTIPLNAISKVDKVAFGFRIKPGDRIKVNMNSAGYAALASFQAIRFTPDEYEAHIADEEFDKLLGVC